ncbi:hypothetical protein C8J56DRAFT_1025165 [Mycena floridula]|nr:hypothetical protein C8J56DRAFT_1025165 [Mycena floridula]
MSDLVGVAQVLALMQQEEQQPSITVFNVQDGGHINFTPDWTNPDETKHESLLELFTRTLDTVRKRGYVVHSATFSAEVALVFVKTDEEDWEEKCCVARADDNCAGCLGKEETGHKYCQFYTMDITGIQVGFTLSWAPFPRQVHAKAKATATTQDKNIKTKQGNQSRTTTETRSKDEERARDRQG